MPESRIRVRTPLGLDLVLAGDGERITASDFSPLRATAGRGADALLREARDQVHAYFKRRLRRFDLPMAFEGTPFNVAVWSAVADLSFGEIVSYADVARAVGRPRAHRGVAAAMRQTPFDLLVPAHRVIGADGKIKGAGVNSLRRRLLVFEGFLSDEKDDAIRRAGRSPRSGLRLPPWP